MKLTERQMALRKAFRLTLLTHWRTPGLTMMWSLNESLARQFDVTADAMHEELSEIPSIRSFSRRGAIQPWLANHYRDVSNAMFEGKSVEHCLALWRNSKYMMSSQTQKRSSEDRCAIAYVIRQSKNTGEVAKLRASMPDRWAKTAWNVCK